MELNTFKNYSKFSMKGLSYANLAAKNGKNNEWSMLIYTVLDTIKHLSSRLRVKLKAIPVASARKRT
jgi:hypothetical protein